MVFCLTLAPRFGVSGALTPNFTPLASIVDLLFDSAATPALMVKNIVGNILLLAPLGALLYAGLGWTWLRALGGVAVVSVFIEIIQANVDDLLLNLLGAGIAIFTVRALVTSEAR